MNAGKLRRNFIQTIKIYKMFQLLLIHFSASFRAVFFPLLFSGATCTLILSLFVCIRLAHLFSESWEVRIFPLAMITSATLNFVFSSMASKVFVNSSAILDKLGERTRRRKSYFTKVLAGRQKMKIYAGQNFLDKETPLVLLMFCSNQSVSLLMIE